MSTIAQGRPAVGEDGTQWNSLGCLVKYRWNT